MFLLRSQDGSIPLHVATRNSVTAIVQLIGDAGPEEAFQMEDGVGHTPLEIATFNWLHISTGFFGILPTVQLFEEGMLHLYFKRPKFVTQGEAKALKDTIDNLVASGQLRKGTKLTTDLTVFAEKKHAEAKKRAESCSHKESESSYGYTDSENEDDAIYRADEIKTMEYIAAAASTRRGPRQLVHLIDVHRSVQGSLDKAMHQHSRYGGYNYRNRGDEEDEQERVKKHSAVSLWHSRHAFGLFSEDNL